jgi:hypothetical protein
LLACWHCVTLDLLLKKVGHHPGRLIKPVVKPPISCSLLLEASWLLVLPNE